MDKHFKKVVAGLLAAAMITPVTAGIAEPMRASAYEILGETSFDYKMLPWQTVEKAPAKQDFILEDGAVHIRILVPSGATREKWDLQFRHRNLSFQKGHKYKVSFRAKSERAGFELYSYIGSYDDKEYFVLDGVEKAMYMGPDMDGRWPSSYAKLNNEWQTFEGIFTPTEDIDAALWTFQYARGTQYSGNAQAGDEIWFDDMSIDDITDPDALPPEIGRAFYNRRDDSGLAYNYISVNQLGYCKGLSKKATLGDNKGDFTFGAESIDLEGSYDYQIVDNKTDKVVYTGRTSEAEMDIDSGDTVCKIDFTNFNDDGEYYIRIKGKEWRSFPFTISSALYNDSSNDMLTNSLNFFYQNRSGEEISEKFISSGKPNELAHDADKDEGNGYIVRTWSASRLNTVSDIKEYSSSKLDVSGGWYNADSYDKSMLEGGISLWTLQNMYERTVSPSIDSWIHKNSDQEKFDDGSGTVLVPEVGNKIPDILDECKYELDFMSKMKVSSDDETWGEYAGMYYNGTKGINIYHNKLDYIDENYSGCNIVLPPTFAATLNYAACAAQAARLWQPYDAEYAAELLKSAKEAFAAYEKNYYDAGPAEYYNEESLYAYPYNGCGSIYGGNMMVKDDAYWAASEIFITARQFEDKDADSYYKKLSDYKQAFTISTRMENDYLEDYVSFTLLNSGNTAAAGSMSLLLNSELLESEDAKKLKDSLLKTADDYIDAEEDQGYSLPYLYDGPGYSSPTGIMEIELYGFEYGSNFRALSNMLAMAYAYDITGESKYINGVSTGMDYLLGNNPLSFSYITGYGTYSANNPGHRVWRRELDTTLPAAPDGVIVSGPSKEWPDPYIRGLGYDVSVRSAPSERYYVDSVESWATNESELSGNAALAWIVSFMQDEASGITVTDPVAGDVNSDGEFTVADAVQLQLWLLGDKKAKLSNWEAGDLCKDGVLDVFDLIQMKKALISK